ncbi:acyl carrier protein [Kutzneria kofuensis]|uniref:Acyl carrier protein n=1 Tax=Kutzneria kofuensis TaxID=103725 RepID=A0A7W9KPU3_9PSEU|nr:phosphopantetheine-binding protein [Kutzneria kofuensis]MBB5896501.1 acyl carrier protein [Kutzneria kofuensis]
MNRDEITGIVRSRIEQILGDERRIGDLDPLTYHGLDSLRSVDLTLSLENRFALVFEDDELDFENFRSVRRIVDLIAAKVGADE